MPIAARILSLLALAAPSALAWPGGSASTEVSEGGVRVTGLDDQARHVHGGAPARLGHARFRVRSEDEATLTVRRIAFLTGRGCDAPPTEVRSEPALGGLFVEGMEESARTLPLPAGESVELTVGFPAVEAYYTHCDRFAFRVTFDVDGRALTATAETNVTREEPLRERSPEAP